MSRPLAIWMGTRGTFLVLLLLSGAGAMGSPMANGSACYSIKGRDARQQCLAEVRGNYSYCYSIREHGGRQFCLAKTKRQRSYCYAIKREEDRKWCLAGVR